MSKMGNDVPELVENLLHGEESSLAHLITLVEGNQVDAPQVMELVSNRLGKAYRIGITGPPGGGKSTLIDKLTAIMRGKRLSVGIVAVDPSSPITGGAVLGDRIRMQKHYLDKGVFIRSMGTRGSYGGLSAAVNATVNLLDAFGKDIIIVETVGTGQVDISIAEVADIVVLVLAPGFGDSIQLMKAGLLEVSDIIVVNKADSEGSEMLLSELQDMVTFNSSRSTQSVMATQAINDVGIEELYQEIEKWYKNKKGEKIWGQKK